MFSRRNFIITAASAFTNLLGCQIFSSHNIQGKTATNELILIPTLPELSSKKAYLYVYKNGFNNFDKIEIPLIASHSIVVNPVKKTRVLVIEKWGPSCCEVDLLEMKVISTIKAMAGRDFYGHGVYSKDGKLFYATEAGNILDEKGYIVVRDGVTFKFIGEFPSYGSSPHDLNISDDGKVLIVSNTGLRGTPNVAYIDIKTETLIHKVINKDARMTPEHFILMKDSYIFIGYSNVKLKNTPVATELLKKLDLKKSKLAQLSAYNLIYDFLPAPVCIANANGKNRDLIVEDSIYLKMRHTLSIAADDVGKTVGVTHNSENGITFWDVSRNCLIKYVDCHALPLGITFDKVNDYFIVTTKDNKIHLLDGKNLSIVKSIQLQKETILTSHILYQS